MTGGGWPARKEVVAVLTIAPASSGPEPRPGAFTPRTSTAHDCRRRERAHRDALHEPGTGSAGRWTTGASCGIRSRKRGGERRPAAVLQRENSTTQPPARPAPPPSDQRTARRLADSSRRDPNHPPRWAKAAARTRAHCDAGRWPPARRRTESARVAQAASTRL